MPYFSKKIIGVTKLSTIKCQGSWNLYLRGILFKLNKNIELRYHWYGIQQTQLHALLEEGIEQSSNDILDKYVTINMASPFDEFKDYLMNCRINKNYYSLPGRSIYPTSNIDIIKKILIGTHPPFAIYPYFRLIGNFDQSTRLNITFIDEWFSKAVKL